MSPEVKHNRQHIQGVFYSNVLVVGKNNEFLSTVSTKKANWYLNKQLANEIFPPPYPYPRAIRLNFTHRTKEKVRKWDLHLSEDKCVMCGKPEHLSLHHIVPSVIRRCAPDKHKKHSRQWCVLLCRSCHNLVEEVSQPQYKTNFPCRSDIGKKTNLTLQILKSKNQFDKVPADRIKWLFDNSDYKTMDEIPPYSRSVKREYSYKVSLAQRDAIMKWAHKFIEDHGGIEGTEKYFLNLFLSFEPKHLPSWFDEMLK